MNKPQPSTAQETTEQTQAQEPTNTQANEAKAAKPKLKPDFSHRLGVFDSEATALNLTDAVSSLALQADGVLAMLGGQFLGDETDMKLSDDVIFWTLESVRATVKDIKAIVAAYYEA